MIELIRWENNFKINVGHISNEHTMCSAYYFSMNDLLDSFNLKII